MIKPNRYIIQERVDSDYEGTQDNNLVKYALDTARCNGDRDTVNVNWRWLCDDLTELYNHVPSEATACYSFIEGWIAGTTHVLSKALLSFFD